MAEHDVIIIGGGISGMSLAHYCAKKGLKPLVVEKNERTGGSFHSFRTDDFWFELGAHSCYNSYGNLVGLLDDAGILGKIVKPGSAGYKIYIDGVDKSIMSQLSIPELLISLPKMFGAKMEGETVESYYSKIVGKNNFNKAICPMFNAVICQRANDFPADMLFKKRERCKDVIKKFSLPGGVQTITDTIAAEAAVATAVIKEITEVEYRGGVFTVKAADGTSFLVSRLALATPAEVAARLLEKSYPDVAQKLAALKAESVETVGVIVRKEAVKIAPVAALAAADDIFYSFVSRDTFPDPVYRGFAFHFKAGAATREARLERIARVLGTKDFVQIATSSHVIPSLRLGHMGKIAEIDRLIADKPLMLTGNYFSGVAIEDCVSRSLQEAERSAR
ncbi:MAG TPA: FAD-dependent oxidoreductase [Geobacteraceae bacterium]|nr:FAD-dependent oxidoreductase [Geobacteraceae bacterium]